ncbi:hypothetical protein K435DRAFT_868642 [Dendrothele bispora CBS 962.96]|uniref:Uncharacterized protein n=1 Tax=Dendrothele bispora (strain CBS 962.96) TaxID=1314807 RepID=A0A4S8LBN9_DENBC|nr:hypothetical protein K435DRAFT_868642 [Dendrothele bispora CBS 962.96]
MARKKLYHTKEERQLADRQKRLKYYHKNADSINTKLRKDYSAAKSQREMNERKSKNKAGMRAKEVACNQSRSRQAQAKSLLLLVNTQFDQLIEKMNEPSPVKYFDVLYASLVSDHPSSHDSVQEQCNIFSTVCGALEKRLNQILDLVGPSCPVYKQAEKIVRKVRLMLAWVEDVYCEVLVGIEGLRKRYNRGKLQYQMEQGLL